MTDVAAQPGFEQLALDCLDDVERFAYSLTRERADADDLVQETFLRAFRGRHTFLPQGDMKRWLFTICKNVYLRGRERSDRVIMSLDGDPTDATLAAVRRHSALMASGEAGLLDRVDLGPAIAGAIAQLSDDARLVVLLVDLEGYGYADAAEALHIPVGTVRSRLFRARHQLQELLMEFARDAGFNVDAATRSDR